MTQEPRFGEKGYGRNSLERIINLLEAHKLLIPTLTLCILVLFIGLNSIVHEKYSNGVLFLILVFLILLTGNEPTKNFFGASALAVFIILHLSLFGFSAIPLILSFMIFVAFKKWYETNLLLPISTYLLLDTIFYYLRWNNPFDKLFEIIGQKLFSEDVLPITLVLPLAYAYLLIERFTRNRFGDNFWGKYGSFLLLGTMIYLFGGFGYFLKIKGFNFIAVLAMLLYMFGTLHFKDNIKISVMLMLPLLIPFLIIRWLLER